MKNAPSGNPDVKMTDPLGNVHKGNEMFVFRHYGVQGVRELLVEISSSEKKYHPLDTSSKNLPTLSTDFFIDKVSAKGHIFLFK